MSDIVERLRDGGPSQCWSCGEWGCTNAAGHDVFCMGDCDCETDCECVCSKCGGDTVCTCKCHEWYDKVRDAADEIERLRAQVYLAHAVLGSEPMIWLASGSNHPEAQLDALKPALDTYWKRYGSAFRPASQRRPLRGRYEGSPLVDALDEEREADRRRGGSED
jgi:hypothetical protein